MMMCVFAFCVILGGAYASESLLSEPSCSKYHFEENVLERLIKMEVKVEQWVKNTEDRVTAMETEQKQRSTESEILAGEVKTEIRKFKEAISETAREMDAIIELAERRSGEVVAFSKKALEDAVQSFNLTVGDKLDEYATNLTAIQQQVQYLHQPIVAFIARDPDDNLPSNAMIIYKTVTLNVGEGYDSQTGQFTAPAAGTYIFSAQICGKAGKHVHYQLVVNEVVHSASRQFEPTFSGVCSSVMTVAVLQVGDTVGVRSVDSGDVVLDNLTYYWNMFTGALVN